MISEKIKEQSVILQQYSNLQMPFPAVKSCIMPFQKPINCKEVYIHKLLYILWISVIELSHFCACVPWQNSINYLFIGDFWLLQGVVLIIFEVIWSVCLSINFLFVVFRWRTSLELNLISSEVLPKTSEPSFLLLHW